ncbi:MAG: hypothetical protein IT372_08275 [Polyangiaceae bacterium]|nr:hypothetical protein [Polyangiaceae bacterium]
MNEFDYIRRAERDVRKIHDFVENAAALGLVAPPLLRSIQQGIRVAPLIVGTLRALHDLASPTKTITRRRDLRGTLRQLGDRGGLGAG